MEKNGNLPKAPSVADAKGYIMTNKLWITMDPQPHKYSHTYWGSTWVTQEVKDIRGRFWGMCGPNDDVKLNAARIEYFPPHKIGERIPTRETWRIAASATDSGDLLIEYHEGLSPPYGMWLEPHHSFDRFGQEDEYMYWNKPDTMPDFAVRKWTNPVIKIEARRIHDIETDNDHSISPSFWQENGWVWYMTTGVYHG